MGKRARQKRYRKIFHEWFELLTYITFGLMSLFSIANDLWLNISDDIMGCLWYAMMFVLIGILRLADYMAKRKKRPCKCIRRLLGGVQENFLEMGFLFAIVSEMLLRFHESHSNREIADIYLVAVVLVLAYVASVINALHRIND